MPATQNDIGDLIFSTLTKYGPPKFSQIAQELQNYQVMGNWLKGNKVQKEKGGFSVTRNLMLDYTQQAQHKALFQQDTITIADVMKKIEMPWVHVDTHWAYNHIEQSMNVGGASKIFDIILSRECQAMLSLANRLEVAAWTLPTAAQTTLPYGIPYYIVKNATVGFNGQNPTGHSSVLGINASTVKNWRNYSGGYSDASDKTDLIKKVRTAFRLTNFRSPLGSKRGVVDNKMKRTLYANDSLISELEELGEGLNENLGRDLTKYMDNIIINGHPVVYVPYLDNDTEDPLYFIDHSTFMPVVLAKEYLRRSKPQIIPGQHNAYVFWINMTYNYLCTNRRQSGVFHKV